MASIEELAEIQKNTGERIEQIIRNFKKDPATKKDTNYLTERLKRLEEEWLQFDTIDTQIRMLENLPLEHDYFQTDYYQSTTDAVQEYKEILERLVIESTQKVMEKQKVVANRDQQGAIQKQHQRDNIERQPRLYPELIKLTCRQGAMMT